MFEQPKSLSKRPQFSVSLNTFTLTLAQERHVKKVRKSLTWFSHGSGAALAPVPLGRDFLFLLEECVGLAVYQNGE